MIQYPISVPVNSYHGKDEKRRVAAQTRIILAGRIENYLNSRMQDLQHCVFTYALIASELGANVEAIRDLLAPLDAGYNGITITK